jgi:hypothetical protein
VASTLKERPKTDNSSLRVALTIQAGESASRVEVKRDGKDVGFEELAKMQVKDLLGCNILVLSLEAGFTKLPPNSILRDFDQYSYRWAAFVNTESGRFSGDEPAVKALESVYQLAIASASGGI